MEKSTLKSQVMILGLVFQVLGQHGQPDIPFMRQLLGSGDQHPAIYAADKTDAGKLALQALTRPSCSALVGGEFRQYVQSRFRNTEHFALVLEVGAIQYANGRIRTLYAYSYAAPEIRRVLLFPGFLNPEGVLVRLYLGQIRPFNTLRAFETAVGLKLCSINSVMLQAIILLHEQAHLNFATFEDADCIFLSTLNSRRVAEACFPNTIGIVAKSALRTPKNCVECHSNRLQVIKTPRAPFLARNPVLYEPNGPAFSWQ